MKQSYYSYLFFLGMVPFFLHAQKAVTHQRLFDTLSTMPAHNAERAAMFEKEPVVTGKIIFLGNSITEGGKWGSLTGDKTVINRGIGGDITFDLLKRSDDIIRRQPSKLFILIGINDISKDIPDAVIADNYRKLVQKIRRACPSTLIYVQSILPVNNTVINFPQHYDKAAHIVSTNILLKQMAKNLHCTYIDLYPLFLDAGKKLAKQYTLDGLHLKPEGYTRWVNYLREKKYL